MYPVFITKVYEGNLPYTANQVVLAPGGKVVLWFMEFKGMKVGPSLVTTNYFVRNDADFVRNMAGDLLTNYLV